MTSFIFLSEYSDTGLPDKINLDENGSDISRIISNDVLDEIALNLPNGETVLNLHPDWIRNSDISTTDACTMTTTFVTEGAGYKNGLGYYVYDIGNPPERFSNIDTVYVIFPNASLPGKGGNLSPGNTMKLIYESLETEVKSGVTYSKVSNYTFPAGKGIGFVCFANGWRNSGTSSAFLNVNRRMFSTNPVLNPERKFKKKHHCVNFTPVSEPETIIFGFEDIRRDKAHCDNDFNDLIFCVNPTPFSSTCTSTVNSETCMTHSGFILCEDISNAHSDVDYNDLTMKYDINEKMEDNLIKSITMSAQILHRGASYNHSFGFIIPSIKQIENCKIYRETYVTETDEVMKKNLSYIIGGNTDKIPLIDNTKIAMPPKDGIFTNTKTNAETADPTYIILKIVFPEGVSRESLGDFEFPYRFYLDIKKNGKVRNSIYSDELYEASAQVQSRYGITQKAKILIAKDITKLRIPKESRPLRRGYRKVIDYFLDPDGNFSWLYERNADVRHVREEILHTSEHIFSNILNFEVKSVSEVSGMKSLFLPTEFSSLFSFTPDDSLVLLSDSNMELSNLHDWSDVDAIDKINKLVSMVSDMGECHILYEGSFFDRDDVSQYYVSLASIDGDKDIVATKPGDSDTLQLCMGTTKQFMSVLY